MLLAKGSLRSSLKRDCIIDGNYELGRGWVELKDFVKLETVKKGVFQCEYSGTIANRTLVFVEWNPLLQVIGEVSGAALLGPGLHRLVLNIRPFDSDVEQALTSLTYIAKLFVDDVLIDG